ncbi:glycosyltransferase family 39 protein [Candidatus Falkowbacteria bacterium]|nr:glycosyltransferase family 39 protein [Candidatus Falkowbacteria bacterium]
MEDLKKKLNNYVFYLILAALAVIFFFIYSYLIYGNYSMKFSWPDETANYFFIKNYIQNTTFSAPEPLNTIADDIIKPRSFNVWQGNLVPGSFLGMLLVYGTIGKVVGLDLMVLLTPLLAVLAGIYFYKLMKLFFEPKIAFLSAMLFFINPAWWYYASFFMLPNISFICFLIMGFYYLLKIDKQKKQGNVLFVILGTFFLSLAMTIRTNEIFWVLPLLLALYIIYRKKIFWAYIPLAFLVAFTVFLPVFYYNYETYGHFLSFGYLRLEQGANFLEKIPTEFAATNDQVIINFLKLIFLPFGFSIKLILINIVKYFVFLFWWLFIPAVIGGAVFLKKFRDKDKIVFLVSTVLVSLYIMIYYGSWAFEDLLTLNLNKIGISYVRYFLPIYIFSLPFIVFCFLEILNYIKNKKLKILLALLLIVSFITLTVNVIYIAGNDNLVKTRAHIDIYSFINKRVLELTEGNSVIISERADKIYFPERKVVGKVNLNEINSWAKLLHANVPLYFYGSADEEFKTALTKQNMKLTDEILISESNYLAKIIFIQ